MNALIGHLGVLLGFVAALVGAGVIAFGLAKGRSSLVRSGQVYAALVLMGALVATFAMERALLTHDYSIVFVAENASRRTPLLYTITGLWSALAGSLLLWGLVLAGYGAAMAWHFKRRAEDAMVGWATLVVYLVTAFFFALLVGPANPFRTFAGTPPSHGAGPNVLLQDNPLVAFHPPMLYLGFVGFTIPFAFAIASLVTGRMGEGWQVETRRWTLFAWACLTVGILLGAWWSYQVLGWGGFWGWDPVENAALLPWLTATAYLHSVMVQERRGLLRVWNTSLVISTFALTILGTFLTRSGVIVSVHAFSDSNIGPLFLGLLAVVLVVGLGLIAWRGDKLRSPAGIDSALSREGAFLANNLLFAAFAFVVLLGTLFPLLYQALTGNQVSVGAPYFDTLTMPLGLALLTLMAVGPALPWRKASRQMMSHRLAVPAWAAVLVVAACVAGGIRDLADLAAYGLGAFAAASNIRQLVLAARASHRRGEGAWRGVTGRANGGMVVHLGVVIIAVALASATSFGARGQVRLAPGQSARFDGHSFTYLGLATSVSPARTATLARVRVDGGGVFSPAVSYYGSSPEGIGTPAIDSSLVDDVYLTVDELPAHSNGPVTIGVVIQPLVMWLWVGGAVLAVGAVLAALPGRRRRRPTDPASVTVRAGGTGEGGSDPRRITERELVGAGASSEGGDPRAGPGEEGG
jgi:cytochrome c-type biogenesis protein CcmF